MADSKISQLASGTPTGTDITNFVQGGVDKKTTFNDLPIPTSVQTALNGKQGNITLTTTGTSGAATLIGNTLNIPQYTGGGGGGGGQILFDAIVAPSGGDYTLLSSAISAGKKTIFVRKGTYNETATITLNTDGITIIGESKKDTIIRFAAGIDGIAQYANNCYVTNITLDGETNNSSAVYIIGDGKTPGSQDLNIGVNNVIDNCILKGPNNTFCIYIAGPTYTPGSATLIGFEANGLHRGNIVRNCELHSSWDGDAFSFSLQKNGAFDNNVCYGGRIAFYMCRNSSCSFNKVVSSANQGIFFAGPSYDNVLNGNTIFDATSSGIKLENQLEHTPLLAGQGIIGNTISNNTVNNSGVNGIEISGTSANPIKDNTFVGNTVNGANDHTIYLQYSERNIIKGNILKNPKMNGGVGRGSGIYLVANVKNNIIEGNTIDGTNYHTAIANREDNSCTGNIIKGNKITGTNTERTIWFQSNETQIEGNSIEGGSYAGIRILDASFCNISDNKLKNNTRDANNAYPEIWIQGSSVDNIIDNNVIISDGANKAAHGISLDGAGVVSTTVSVNKAFGIIGKSVLNTGVSSRIIDNEIYNSYSTAILTYPTITINIDPTKIDISSFIWRKVDGYTDMSNPVATYYTFPGVTGLSITNLATQDVTYLAINDAGSVIQLTTNDNGANSRDRVVIGSAVHTSRIQVDSIDKFVNVIGYDVANSVADLSDAIGIINTGNKFSANGANMKINKSSGISTQIGLNIGTSKKSPNRVTDNPLTATSFLYSWRNGAGGFNVLPATSDNIIANRYDDGTGGASIPNGAVSVNRWSLQKLWYVSSLSLVAVEYGQATYNTQAEAEAARSTETVINPALLGASFRGWLIVRGGATNLSLVTDAVFVDSGKFGSITGGTGSGSSTTTLQQAHDNSALPQIVTNSLELQQKTANTNNTQVWKNVAGTITATIRGDGIPTASTDLVTKAYGDANYLGGGGGNGPILSAVIAGEITVGTVIEVPVSKTITAGTFRVSLKTLPTGADVIVKLYKNGVEDASVTIATGASATNGLYQGTDTTFISGSYVAGDVLKASVTQIGSTLAGTNLSILLNE